MDHLAEQVNFPGRIFLQCPIADLNSVFNTIAKPKMPGEVKAQRAKVKQGRREILLACVL
jgi:hypothetical protein